MADTNTLPFESIAALRVYPPLGIARVGNAGDAYVIGPEVIGGPATHPDGTAARHVDDFRDAEGHIRRQAARFRVYAELHDGTVRELTADNGVSIRWRVTIANLKAGWYEFRQAMDLPANLAMNAPRRNADFPFIPGGRAALDIVPLARTIEGRDLSGPAYKFDDGGFIRRPVYLGELRTDSAGRLIFLGGTGASASFPPNLAPLTFANNTGWHDDTSDGPVRATVSFPGGRTMEAEAGYVAVTPPNFAPGLFGLVTMDDAVRETFRRRGWIAAPTTTAFSHDIWPIFDRLTGLQWVNHGLFVLSGHGASLDARDPAVVARLRDPSDATRGWREMVFGLFRDPDATGPFEEALSPQIYGDAYGESKTDSRVYLSVTPTQHGHLRRWVDGEFDDDWTGAPPEAPDFATLTPSEQVTHLERAGLHDCLGGPFHPGIELTWTMRLPTIWRGAYRLKLLDGDGPARQDYGDTLTPAVCIGAGGPYDGVAAGALTRFLGVPWQTDGTSCNSSADYTPATFLSMPTFWGARVPDQVLAEANYDRMRALWLAGSDGPSVQALKHFTYRADWLRDVRGRDYFDRLQNMIRDWWQLGMVLPVADPAPTMPADLRVEQGRHPSNAGTDPKRALVAAVERLAQPGTATAMYGLAAGASPDRPYQPPKREFRRGEV